jgi:hypothetical protein
MDFEDGTSGQDRESYSDDQDRESYTVKESGLNHAEAQELHEAIGAAIETGDLSGLRRARELAAVLVSDTE